MHIWHNTDTCFSSWFLSLHICVRSWGQGSLLYPQCLEWSPAYCKCPVNICGLNGRLACAPLHVGHIYRGSRHLAQAWCLWNERQQTLLLPGILFKAILIISYYLPGLRGSWSLLWRDRWGWTFVLLAPSQLPFEIKQPLINVLFFPSGPYLFPQGRAHVSPAHCCFLRFQSTADTR